MRPFEIDDEHRPPTTRPPRSPRTSSSCCRSRPPSSSEPRAPRTPASCSPLVLRTAANWSERGADALTGPIARGDEETVERHLEALRERAPELVGLYEALADRTREIAARRTRTRSEPDERRAHEGGPAGRAEPARGRAHDRPRADHGRAARGPPVAARRRAGALRCGRHEPVRQPHPVRAGRGSARVPARRGARPRARRRARGRRRLRPESGGDLPGRVRDRGRGRGRAHRRARGRQRTPGRRPLPRRHHGGGEALRVGRPRRRLLRAEGRPAGDGDPSHGARPRLSRRDRGAADRARAGRPCVELAQRIPRPRGPTPGGRASPRARRGRGGGRRRDHLGRRGARRGAGRARGGGHRAGLPRGARSRRAPARGKLQRTTGAGRRRRPGRTGAAHRQRGDRGAGGDSPPAE